MNFYFQDYEREASEKGGLLESLQGEKFEIETLLNVTRDELNAKKGELEKSNDDNKMLQVKLLFSCFDWT